MGLFVLPFECQNDVFFLLRIIRGVYGLLIRLLAFLHLLKVKLRKEIKYDLIGSLAFEAS